MKHVEKECKFCKNIFLARINEVKRGRAIFCSLRCSTKHRHANFIKNTPKPNVFCSYCLKSFYKSKSKISKSKSGLFFCCREHKDICQKLDGLKEILPAHYGTANGRNDYRKKVDIINCEECGWQIHPEILQVHHIDRNRENNDISNLKVLCPNCHIWDHFLNKDGLYKPNQKRNKNLEIKGNAP